MERIQRLEKTTNGTPFRNAVVESADNQKPFQIKLGNLNGNSDAGMGNLPAIPQAPVVSREGAY